MIQAGSRLTAAILSSFAWLVAAALLLALGAQVPAPSATAGRPSFYLGFDRNFYPGDDALPMLRKTFAFTGYWLSPPPGERTNTWKGKRKLLFSHGFGFLALYRGRTSGELQNEAAARKKGSQDARSAAASAKAEGFAPGTIIFLDVEEGGRLSAAYHAYLRSWIKSLAHAGFRAGVYCSAIPVSDGPGVTITTAGDILSHARAIDITIWAYNDVCPPSPGCIFPENPPSPDLSGNSYAAVWQFAQSPRRKEFTSQCDATYQPDGHCYAPGDSAHSWFLDVNSATSPDPSSGARQD